MNVWLLHDMIGQESILVVDHLFFVFLVARLWGTVYPKKYAHVFALLCFVVVIHWLIFPYPSGLLHWHYGNLTIAPVPAKQPWWIWINTSCEFIMNDCITTTKQSTTKPCAYFLGYTVYAGPWYCHHNIIMHDHTWTIEYTVYTVYPKKYWWWSKPDGYGKISQCITTTKHSKAKTVCIFLGIYCMWAQSFDYHQ